MFVMIIQNEPFLNYQNAFPKEFLDETKKLWEPLLGRYLDLAEVHMLIERGLYFVDWFSNQAKTTL